MNIETFRDYCISKRHVTEEFPFDQSTLVFKVAGKMFALCDVELFESANLKCNPEKAVQLREEYNGIKPGYHMNKVHWNTVQMNLDVPDKLILELIDHSYNLVFASLPKRLQAELNL